MLERIADGRTDLVFEYLDDGHEADATDAHGVSLIQWCAYYGDVSAIRHLVASGADLASLGDNLDLNGAAFHGHWRLCQFLLEHGADANRSLPETGETPLHSALCTPRRPAYDHVVRLLLDAGADPNRVTIPHRETGSFMRDSRTRGETPLHRAAAYGNEEAIRMLLAAGADREARDVHGDSPLSWASYHRRPAYILEALCFGDERIHPDAVRLSRAHAEFGWGGMEYHLLGTPHVGTGSGGSAETNLASNR